MNTLKAVLNNKAVRGLTLSRSARATNPFASAVLHWKKCVPVENIAAPLDVSVL